MKVKWYPQHSTAQIYSSGVELALVSADNEQIGPFVYCKDFFQDAIRGFVNDISSGIWGYTYDPKKQPPIDLKKVRVLLAHDKDPDFLKKVPALVDLLNQIEKKMGLSLTTATIVNDPPAKYKSGVVMLVGDGAWLRSSASLSMYTLLARNGLVHKSGTPFNKTLEDIMSGKLPAGQKNDGTYMKYGKPGIDLIIAKGIDEVFGTDTKANYKASVPTHTIHHYGGIVAFGSGKTEATWPNWKHPKEKSNPPGECFS